MQLCCGAINWKTGNKHFVILAAIVEFISVAVESFHKKGWSRVIGIVFASYNKNAR